VPEQDFLPFASAAGANVITQAAYVGQPWQTGGFSAGLAQSIQLNKVWRQSSIIASVVAQAICDVTGQTVIDDGTIATIEANLIGLIRSVGGTYQVDSGAVNALAIVLANPPSSLAGLVGIPLRIKVAHTNTGAVTLTSNSFTATPLVHPDGTPMFGGELLAGAMIMVVYDGTSFQLVSDAPVIPGRLLNVQAFTASGTYTPTVGMRSARVQVQGAGGGAGGTATPGVGQDSISCGGLGGHWSIGIFSAAAIGASLAITIGAGGTGGAGGVSSGSNGGSGGNTSFGTLLQQPGNGFGQGGGLYSTTATVVFAGSTAVNTTNAYAWRAGGLTQGGTTVWQAGGVNILNIASNGGTSMYSAGGAGSGQSVGQPGSGFGGGGGGTNATASSGPFAGGSGSGGLIIVEEYS
jgi:hypothetical protein